MQDILAISLLDHYGLRRRERLVASCAGGQTSRPYVIIVPFLLVHYLLILLDRLLTVLLIRGCCALLRRCSCPSGLGGCFSRRYTTRFADEAASLWKAGSWPLMLSHAFTLLSRGVFRLLQTVWVCSAGIGVPRGQYPCSKGCVRKR
jgi:hypothetical protein